MALETVKSVITSAILPHPASAASIMRATRADNFDRSLVFSTDCRRVAVGSSDFRVRVWDLDPKSTSQSPLHGHTGDLRFVNFSSDNRRVVSCAFDNTVRIWDCDVNNEGTRMCSFGPDKSLALQHYPCIVPSDPSTSALHCTHTPTFRLTDDGWVEDFSCDPPHLLLWVPPERRKGLYIPPMSLIISPHETWTVDLSNFAHGTRWTTCFSPPNMMRVPLHRDQLSQIGEARF